MTADVAVSGSKVVAAAASALMVPAMLGDPGERAARRFLEFFAATTRNRNTRLAYYRAATRFLP